jgi:uncharacterized protein (DUF2126 family)
VEVRVAGINTDRYQLLVNRVKVPLRPTGIHGEYVSGIRYKAWAPPSALHPTLEVDVPLTIDLYDSWNKRSIGGCTYYVSHPGGRAYATFPINSFEAEGRRISRFWDFGHSQAAQTINLLTSGPERSVQTFEARELEGPIEILPALESNWSLDLRRKRAF